MMKQLIDKLHEGGHSLVVWNGAVAAYNGRGVSDLYRLVHDSSHTLCGAAVADKAIGKAAAALMVMGGVREAYADVASTPALALLRRHGVMVSCGIEVHHITNRSGMDWCPMERNCWEKYSVEEIYQAVTGFLDALKKS